MNRFWPALFLLLSSCETASYMRLASPSPAPGLEETKLRVFQTTRFAHAGQFPLYELVGGDAKLLGFSERGYYFEVRCLPGKHTFVTWGDGTAFIEADMKPGLTYYIEATSEAGLWNAKLGFTPITRGSEAMRRLDDVWPGLRCKEIDPDKASTYRSDPEERKREIEKVSEEGRKNPQYLRQDDGRDERKPQPRK